MQHNIQKRLEKDFKGKKVLIVGLGLQGGGVGLAEFLSQIGANVIVTDLKSKEELAASLTRLKNYAIEYHLSGHPKEVFLNVDYIFKGPSVPWDLPELFEAGQKGIRVDMEAAYVASLIPDQIIGITGTRGKSTTAQLSYEVLRAGGKNVVLGGNVKDVSTIQLLENVNNDTSVILELSSWQLSGFHKRKISPHIAIFTSFFPDHLNYYRSMEEYFYDKTAIFKYQKPNDILIAHESLKERFSEVHSKIMLYSAYQGNLHIKGEHNKENTAAVKTLGDVLQVNPQIVKDTIEHFKGVPYRLELIRTKDDVEIINDTTSTTPTATIKAIEAYKEKPITIILGGMSKGLPYDGLIDSLKHVSHIVLLKGTFTDEVIVELKNRYAEKMSVIFDNFEGAIKEAFALARTNKNSVLLLSPGAASFVMFQNEFHRGDEFNRIVRTL